MPYETVTPIVKEPQPDGKVRIVVQCAGTGVPTVPRDMLLEGVGPAEFLAQARAVIARLNSNQTTAGSLTLGAPVDLTPPTPPAADADQPLLDTFADRWRLFLNGQRGIDRGVLLLSDPDVAALKTQITNALSAATTPQKRKLLGLMFGGGF